MKNPVLAAPKHKLYTGVNFNYRHWDISTGIQYISGLYTQTDPIKTEEFVLLEHTASYQACRWLNIWHAVRTCWRKNMRLMQDIRCHGQQLWLE